MGIHERFSSSFPTGFFNPALYIAYTWTSGISLATRVKLKTKNNVSGTSVHRIFINVSATVLKLPGAGGAACKNSLTQDFPSQEQL